MIANLKTFNLCVRATANESKQTNFQSGKKNSEQILSKNYKTL